MSAKIIVTMGFTHPWIIWGVFNTEDKRHYFFLLSFACLPWSLDRAGQGPKVMPEADPPLAEK